MAERKDSFILYTDCLACIEPLDMEARGKLFTAVLEYVKSGDTHALLPAEQVAFMFIKQQIDREANKYAETCRRRSEAGKMGGRPKKQGKPEESKKSNCFSEKAKKADNEHENDPDNENDPVPEPDRVGTPAAHKRPPAPRFIPPTVEEVAAYCQERRDQGKANNVDPERFCDYYTAQGWVLSNGQKMKEWRCSVRNWEKRDSERPAGAGGQHGAGAPPPDFNDPKTS